MSHFFEGIYHFINRKKLLSLLLLIVLFSSCFFFASRITLEEDITKIIPKGEKNDLVSKVVQQLNFSDKIAVMIHLNDEKHADNLTEAAHLFIDTLELHQHYFTKIQGKVDLDQMEEVFDLVYQNLPLFLDSTDYEALSLRLGADSISAKMQQNYNSLISPTGMIAKQYILKDPLGLSFIGLSKLRGVGVSDEFQINDGFITSANGRTIILFITPTHAGTDTEKNVDFVHFLYRVQDDINTRYDGVVELSYFGSPFIALANAQQIKQDIQRTVLISISILMFILIIFYRNIFVPLILFIPVICGAVFSAACIYFMKDSVSAISLSIGAVLLGITLDYPLHIITHYRTGASVSTLYKHITKPILSSSLTTAAAFLCLLFVNSEVLHDLGIFAAISVLVSAICALTITPHIYKPKTVTQHHFIDKIAQYAPHNNKWLFTCSLIIIAIGLFTYSNVKFNNNLADLNYIPDNMKKSEKQLEELGSIGSKSIYVATYGDGIEEVLDNNFRLEQKLSTMKSQGLIEDYTSMGRFVLSKKEQEKKIKRWTSFWEKENLNAVATHVNVSANEIGFKKDIFNGFKNQIDRTFNPLTYNDYIKIDILSIDDFLTERNGFYTFSSILKIDNAKRDTLFQTLEQENLVLVDRKHLNEQFLGQLRDDFLRLMNLCFIVIFVIMLFFFRRIELALLAMIPIVFTGFITAGTMSLLGIELNVFSTIVTTLILGLGIDFSIFMTSGLQMKYTTGKDELPIYRTSILLAVITTILALGALIFAKHPALTSISFASLIGVFSALIMTFVFYPKIFALFIEKRPMNGKSPASLRLFVTTVISYLYYGLGGIVYSIFGVFFMRLVPIKKERKERWYRKAISKAIKSVMFSNPGLSNKFINPTNEKFDKPAIIIANHSSFLDTLSIGFIPTQIIFLVNDWVYNSPIFGKAVQLAGYYPVSSGIENGEQKLIEFIEKGNSLVIFPEGTRSKNRQIGRFHKGAFYLAKEYNLDIIPVYIHGNSDLVPKGDFIIFNGRHTLVIGERIPHSTFVNQDVKTITKNISTSFKNHFEELRHRLEGEDYFKKKIQLSFLYKSIDVIDAAKLEFEKYKKQIYELNKLLPTDARIQRVGDDYGIIDLLLCMQEPRRKITTKIYNEYKRMVAQQNYLLKACKISYDVDLTGDAEVFMINTIFTQEEFDTLIVPSGFETIVIEQACFKGYLPENYQLIFSMNTLEVYKTMNNGEKI